MSRLLEAGYRVVTRHQFDTEPLGMSGFTGATSLTSAEIAERHAKAEAGLRERAKAFEGAFVIYDPFADEDGMMIIGDDRDELVMEARTWL